MKELKRTIKETSYEDKLKAFAIIQTNESLSAKEFINQEFNLDGYVKTYNVLTDLETGEIIESDGIVLRTVTGEVVGTNSTSLINSLDTIIKFCSDNNIQLKDVPLILTKGISRNGREFISCEIKQ